MNLFSFDAMGPFNQGQTLLSLQKEPTWNDEEAGKVNCEIVALLPS